MKWICEAAKSLDVFPLAGSIALRPGQRHRDSIFSTCANCKRVVCVLWFKQARSKFHLWWLVITCNEWLFLDHPNPSLRMSNIILPGGNSQVWKRLEAQISASSKTLSSHVREWPNFFKCEVRRAPFLVCNPSLDAICRAQQRAGCKCFMGKAALKTRSQAAHLQTRTGEHSWITLAYDSYPSSIGLSQDMWHCGRRCL